MVTLEMGRGVYGNISTQNLKGLSPYAWNWHWRTKRGRKIEIETPRNLTPHRHGYGYCFFSSAVGHRGLCSFVQCLRDRKIQRGAWKGRIGWMLLIWPISSGSSAEAAADRPAFRCRRVPGAAAHPRLSPLQHFLLSAYPSHRLSWLHRHRPSGFFFFFFSIKCIWVKISFWLRPFDWRFFFLKSFLFKLFYKFYLKYILNFIFNGG